MTRPATNPTDYKSASAALATHWKSGWAVSGALTDLTRDETPFAFIPLSRLVSESSLRHTCGWEFCAPNILGTQGNYRFRGGNTGRRMAVSGSMQNHSRDLTNAIKTNFRYLFVDADNDKWNLSCHAIHPTNALDAIPQWLAGRMECLFQVSGVVRVVGLENGAGVPARPNH